MRKLFFLLLTVTMIYSCGKDNVTPEINNTITEKRNGIERLAEGIDVRDGMLSFESQEQFETVAIELARLTEEHDDAFVDANDELTLDELDELEERIGHNDVQPLVDFERILAFESRRTVVAAQTERWLANEELDFANNPEAIDPNSAVVRTLLNPDGMVLIRGERVDLNLKAAGDDCWKLGIESDYGFYNGGSRAWAMIVLAQGTFVNGKSHCTGCNYKKKSNGNWKKKRAKMSVNTGGILRDRHCREKDTMAKGKTKKRKCLGVTAVDGTIFSFEFYQRKFEDNEIGGSLYIYDTPVNETLYIDMSE